MLHRSIIYQPPPFLLYLSVSLPLCLHLFIFDQLPCWPYLKCTHLSTFQLSGSEMRHFFSTLYFVCLTLNWSFVHVYREFLDSSSAHLYRKFLDYSSMRLGDPGRQRPGLGSSWVSRTQNGWEELEMSQNWEEGRSVPVFVEWGLDGGRCGYPWTSGEWL